MMTYMSVSVLMIDLGNLRYAAKYFPAPRFRPPVACKVRGGGLFENWGRSNSDGGNLLCLIRPAYTHDANDNHLWSQETHLD